jgi:excisionase family DNA binding protein
LIVPDREFFRTGEVARLSGFSASAIRSAMDSKKLRSVHMPGSRYRRVSRAELIKFLKAMGHEIEDQT